MEIGKPQREWIVDPLELPEPLRAEPQPDRVREREPENVPAFAE